MIPWRGSHRASAKDSQYPGQSPGSPDLMGIIGLTEQIIDLYNAYDQNKALLCAIGEGMIGGRFSHG